MKTDPLRRILLVAHLVTVVLVALACGRQLGGGKGSETSWLKACSSDSECGDLSCLCGLCTSQCSVNEDCTGVGEGASCVRSDSTTVCDSAGAANRLCLAHCERTSECALGFTCQDGFCVDAAVDVQESPAATDAGARPEPTMTREQETIGTDSTPRPPDGGAPPPVSPARPPLVSGADGGAPDEPNVVPLPTVTTDCGECAESTFCDQESEACESWTPCVETLVDTPGTPTSDQACRDGWARRIDLGLDMDIESVAVDAAGDLYVAGSYDTLASSEWKADSLVAKVSGGDGAVLWIERLLLPVHNQAHDVAVDSNGDVVVGGHIWIPDGNGPAYVKKYDPADGTLIWSSEFGAQQAVWRLAIDAVDDIAIAGWDAAVAPDANNGMWGRLSGVDGEVQWQKSVGVPFDSILQMDDIAVADDGDLLMVGYTDSQVFDGIEVSGYRGFAMKASSLDGSQIWASLLAEDYTLRPRSIALSDGGELITSGYREDPDHATATYVGALDTDDGELLWSYEESDVTGTGASTVAIDSRGNILLSGYTYDDRDGNDNAGRTDAFVMSFSADGLPAWTEQFGTSRDENNPLLVLDATDRIFVVGSSSGDLTGEGPPEPGFGTFVVQFVP